MTTAQHIVASSLKLFYRMGFHASGVDLLSQEAGVTKKTLYRHYPSKDALIDAALALRHSQFMAKMRAAVETTPIENRPLAYLEFIAHWTGEDDFHGCAFINASAEFANPTAPPHQQAAAHKGEVQRYLQDLCAAAGARQPGLIAQQLFLLGEGLIVASQVQGHDAAQEKAAQALASAAWLAAKSSVP
ncbi:MAG: TetR/AcrR family transcriptional regulator [Pseudomonas sp.]